MGYKCQTPRGGWWSRAFVTAKENMELSIFGGCGSLIPERVYVYVVGLRQNPSEHVTHNYRRYRQVARVSPIFFELALQEYQLTHEFSTNCLMVNALTHGCLFFFSTTMRHSLLLLFSWSPQREGQLPSREVAEPVSSTPPVAVTAVETNAPVIPPETNAGTSTANGQQDRQDSAPPLSRVMSSPRGLKHVDSLAVLRAEADKTYQVTHG